MIKYLARPTWAEVLKGERVFDEYAYNAVDDFYFPGREFFGIPHNFYIPLIEGRLRIRMLEDRARMKHEKIPAEDIPEPVVDKLFKTKAFGLFTDDRVLLGIDLDTTRRKLISLLYDHCANLAQQICPPMPFPNITY